MENSTPENIFNELSKRFTGMEGLKEKKITEDDLRTCISFLAIVNAEKITSIAIYVYHDKPDFIEFKSKTYQYPEELDGLANDIKVYVKSTKIK